MSISAQRVTHHGSHLGLPGYRHDNHGSYLHGNLAARAYNL